MPLEPRQAPGTCVPGLRRSSTKRTLLAALVWALVVSSAPSSAARDALGGTQPLRLDSVAPPSKEPRPEKPKGPERRRAPVVRFGRVEASPGIPAEVIERILRQSFGRYRLCYENALKRNPKLQGTFVMRFAIYGDGAMSSVQNEGSTVPDAKVIGCIMDATAGLTFPKPDAEWGATEGVSVKVRVPVFLELP